MPVVLVVSISGKVSVQSFSLKGFVSREFDGVREGCLLIVDLLHQLGYIQRG